MAANAFAGDDWNGIIDVFTAGRPAEEAAQIKQMLAAKDRKLDAYFTIIDKGTYTPVLNQNGVAVTYNSTDYIVEGFRVGPWISLNVWTSVTGTGTAGQRIDINVPPQFPIKVGGGGRPIGTFIVQDASAGPNTRYHGYASPLAGGLGVYGYVSGNSTAMGVVTPGTALANGDEVGFSIQYMTDVPSL